MRMFRVVPMAVMTVAVMWTAGVANAGFIVSTTVPASTNEIRTAGNSNGGIITAVNVGGSNVTINSFGTFGQQLTNGNLKFLIFGTTIGSSPLYSSGSISTLAAPGVNQWYDAPSFTFTLLANTSYRIGVISDQNFNYNWGNGPSVSGGGLTIPSSPNGNTGSSFSAPVNFGDGGVQQSFRAFQNDAVVTAVPLPPTVLLAAGMAGLFGLRGLRRRLA